MTASTTSTSLLSELAWRGLLSQHTEGLEALLASGVTSGYCGFDPTAPSLHVGNLVPVMGLVHLQRAGHRPFALVGGGTGMIGDPSGKAEERQLNTPEVVEANVRGIRAQLERFLDFSGPQGAKLANNADWLLDLRAVDFMRDVGKHFTVNYMMQKESVKTRLASDTGISYTEFSYMLLQAYDFLELCRREGVMLQLGGSDQWGNMTAGTSLIRKVLGREAQVLTLPLVTTASGEKFGKSAGNAVWLDPDRTSPYQFFQYWINADDRDVGRFLRFFTLLDQPTIEGLERELAEHPERRTAQRELAREVTTRVHGADAARVAEEVSALLFGGGEAGALSPAALEALRREIPFVEFSPKAADAPAAGDPSAATGLDVLEMAVLGGLVKSKGEARRLAQQGGLYVNGQKTTGHAHRDQLLGGSYILLRKGGRSYALVRVTG